MKIAVCVKHVPCGTLRMRPDSGTLDRSGPGELNATDKNAIEEALRLKEGSDAEVVRRHDGPGGGDGVAAHRAWAWAPTARCWSTTTAVAGSDLVATSRVLAAVLERESADLVLFGQQTSDGGGAVLWAAVAERLQLPFVSQATKLTLGDGVVTVDRETEVGNDTHRGEVARRRGGERRDQRAALHVAEGDDGREEEAARHVDRVRPRDRSRRGGRRRLADRRARHRRAAGPCRRGRRSRTTAPRPRRSSTTWRSATSYESPRLPRAPRARALARDRSACSPRRPRSIPTSPRCSSATTDLAAARRARPAGTARPPCSPRPTPSLSPLPGPRIDVLGRARAQSAASTPSCSRTRCSRPTSPPGSRRVSTPASTGISSTSSCATASRSARQPMLQDSVLAEVGWRSPQRIALFRPARSRRRRRPRSASPRSSR